MKSILSIIYLQTNTLSNEKIAVGLLAISDNEIFLELSEDKIKFGSKLTNSDIIKHLELSFGLIKNKVNLINDEKKSHKLLNDTNLFTKEYINYLNKYSKGFLQFDSPKSYAGNIDKFVFIDLFQKFIGKWNEEKKNLTKQVQFHTIIKKQLNNPVFKEKTDIDYILKPNNIKGLLKPHDVTLISKNGSILAAKAIDFNNSEEVITKHTYELEIIANCLNNFGKETISKSHIGDYYLLFNTPPKNSQQEKLLNDIIKTKKGILKIEEASFLKELESKLEKTNYSKFSLFESSLSGL